MDLKICSLNVRGLGKRLKRRETFNWLRAKRFSIYLLQETHCSENTPATWSSEWGYKTLFSCCTSASGGVAILFNNNFAFQLERSYSDPKGRFIICDIETNGRLFTLATIYAPNDDDPAFFESFFSHLQDFHCDDIILGGDFNLVLNLQKDKKGGLAKTHTKAVNTINEHATKFDLVDAWRVSNPDVLRYTWRRRKPEIHCRLDFFLVSQSLMCDVTHTDISAGFKTDHSMVTIQVALHTNPRGPGFWKLNTSFLSETEYINQIRTTIEGVKDEYQNDKSVSASLLWEMIKLKVREQTLRYAKIKKTKMLREEEELEKKINTLQRQIDSVCNNANEKLAINIQLEQTTKELEKIIEYRTKGAILRAKCRWYNEGEKNSKYFLNLEKRHYKNGVISQLKLGDNEFASSDKEILTECETFYRNIYSSKADCDDSRINDLFFGNTASKSLNPEEKEKCEGMLTKAECLQALKSMKPGKTPGSDGLPIEFYKVFWNEISDCLLNAINYAYIEGKFSISQRRGIIKLIPKKDAEPYFVKNWRPITLLNSDYKIAAKAIANRLQNVLPKLIDSDQTGFLKGRFIGENIRLIDGLINHTAARNIPGLLMFLDFEKAFDTVEWSFIWKALSSFNFGTSLINWIKLCYRNIESCVLNNGWASNYFTPERGVRQGCPLSPYIFILCAEVLANKIRANKDIKGITVCGNEIKISQYADDTTMILDGSKKSFTSALLDLELFGEISGLRLNSKKTEILWIGACAGRQDKLCPEKDLKWVTDKLKALGVWISSDPMVSMKANYNEKLQKVKNCLSGWEYRRLSLLGKIVVLKSLIASQLVYILSPLSTNQAALDEINNVFYSFLWSGRGDKIKRDVMISDYKNGGLRMIDIKSFNKALKSTWVKKYLDNNNHGKWKLLFDSELRDCGGDVIFKGNLNKSDLAKFIHVSDAFTTEILKIWSEISYDSNITSTENLLSLPLWQNSLVRIGNKPIYYKSWSSKGIQNVRHLMKDADNFLSFTELKERFDVKTNFLVYHGLVSCIKSLRNAIENENEKIPGFSGLFVENFIKAPKPNRLAYKKLVSAKQSSPRKSQEKWSADCSLQCSETIDWEMAYKLPFCSTKDTKLIIFQFKLLHRRLATNDFLNKIGIKDNDTCTFCRTEKETLFHLFWSCSETSCFWRGFMKWLAESQIKLKSDIFTPDIIIGLRSDTLSNTNRYFYFLAARYYIWSCKTKEILPKIERFPGFLSSLVPSVPKPQNE